MFQSILTTFVLGVSFFYLTANSFAVSPEEESVVVRFIERLVDGRYSQATKDFAPSLLPCFVTEGFESQMHEITLTGLGVQINPPNSGGLTTIRYYQVGKFQKLLETKLVDHSGGKLWECLCQCEKTKLLVRVALDDSARIAGYQMLLASGEEGSDLSHDYNMYYRGDLLLERLGHFCSIALETNQPSTVRISMKNLTFWQKRETPEGICWREYVGPLSGVPTESDKQDRIIVRGLPVGNYFVTAVGLKQGDHDVYCEGGPVSVSAENRQQKLILSALNCGELRIITIDAETGDILDGTQIANIKRKDDLTPSKQFFRSSNSSTSFLYHQVPPGTYTFEASKPDNKKDEPRYVPEKNMYEIEVPNVRDGKAETTVRFVREAWNEEKLAKRLPFVLKGTVKTPEGTPLSGAKIVFTYIHHDPIRVRNFENVGPEEFTDENGNFSFRFSSRDLAGRDAQSEFYRTNPEENWISIQAEKDGYTNLAYVKNNDFQPTNDNYYSEERFLQRPTIFQYLTVNPKPDPERKPDPRIKALGTINGPPSHIPRMYPDETVELNFVLVPSVQILGRIESDSDEKNNDPTANSFAGGSIQMAGPAKVVTIKKDGSFQMNVLPQKNAYFTTSAFMIRSSVSVDYTPDFTLEKTGKYEVVLKYEKLEKNGNFVKKLSILSFKDPEGNDVSLTETPKSSVQNFMFLRWRFKGKVHDDTGVLVPEPLVYVTFNSERGGGMDCTDTKIVAPGEYETSFIPKQYSFDKTGTAYMPPTTVFLQASVFQNKGESERFILSEKELEKTIDITIQQNVREVIARVLDAQGKRLDFSEYDLQLGTQGALRYRDGTLFIPMGTGTGDLMFRDISPNIPLWFVLYDRKESKEKYWGSETIVLQPGEEYDITLRLQDAGEQKKERKFSLEKILDLSGNDKTKDVMQVE